MKHPRVTSLMLSCIAGIGGAGFGLAACGRAGGVQTVVTVESPARVSSPPTSRVTTPEATAPTTTRLADIPTTTAASDAANPTTAATRAPSTTTATTATTAGDGSTAGALSPDVVPATVTPAYVDAVLTVLNHIYGNATRLMVATNTIPLQIPTDLRAIFGDPEYSSQIEVFSVELDQGFADVRKPLGDRVTTVVRILSASPSCIYVQDHTTFDHTSVDPVDDPYPQYLALETKSPANDPDAINPTPWAIFYDVSFAGPAAAPPNPCVA